MGVPKSSNSDKIPHTNLIQESIKIEAKVMKTSDSMAWECKLFTHDFLGFRATNSMEIKINIHTSHMDSPKSSKLEKSTHKNMIKNSFKIEAKFMKFSD